MKNYESKEDVMEIPYKYDHHIKLDMKTMIVQYSFNENYKLEILIQNISDPPYKEQFNTNLALISSVQINISCALLGEQKRNLNFIDIKNIYCLKENPKLM